MREKLDDLCQSNINIINLESLKGELNKKIIELYLPYFNLQY